jgi:hypothetical protein
VLDRELLRTLWRSDCARRLEVIAASRESIQLERTRINGELDRVRIQPPLSAAAAAARPRPDGAGEELTTFKAAARRFVRVQSLLAEIEAVAPQASPEALAIADAWDALLADPFGAAEAAPAPAPVAPAPLLTGPRAAAPDPAQDARRVELDRLHRAAVKAEARLFGRRLLPRKLAVDRYNEARLREQAALAGAGVDSYGEFLLSLHPNERVDDRVQPAPAEAPSTPIADAQATAFAARAEELRARARALLGREPGDDLAGELRAHLALPAVYAGYVEELVEVLADEGPTDADHVIARARAFIAAPPSVHIPQPPTWAMRVSKSEVPLSEFERHEEQLVAKDEMIGALDGESARLTATRDVDLLRLGPDDFVRVVGALFDAYRAGEVLEGHLPLVLDGVLDGLAGDARDAAVRALAAVDDIQVIVVTDEATVARRVREAGGTIVQWPASESTRVRDRSG